MEWWAWLIIGVAAMFVLMMIVAMAMAIHAYRQANRQIRLTERRIGSPLWSYETHQTFPPPIFRPDRSAGCRSRGCLP